MIRALRQAARALRRPLEHLSSDAYYAWAAEQHRRARQRGAAAPRLPHQAAVERHLRSWARALSAAKGGSVKAAWDPL